MQARVLLAVLLSLSVLGVGCAQDVGDIDRTGPNKLRKSVFEGEWYMRATVVDVPATSMASFVGLEGATERIRWNIQEDVLFGHRVHEDVMGIATAKPPVPNDLVPGESPALFGVEPFPGGDFLGAPVVAFPIQSQFDVQRQYNSSTGEQQNVITENSSDRYWRDTEWIRVAWGRNQIETAVDPIVEIEWQTDPGVDYYDDLGETYSPLYVECKDADGNWIECHPDTLTEDDEVAYIETNIKMTAWPSWIDCIFEFGFPLYGGDCGPETITVRYSFVKIDPEEADDYQPRTYTDNEMDWFGFFRTERCAYDRLYGCRDQTTVRLANRHNIWDKWQDADGKEIAYPERTPNPITYYISDVFPPDVMDQALDIADQYNETFSTIVSELGNTNLPAGHRMFYLCANSGSDEEKARVDAAIANETLDATYGDSDVWTELTLGYEHGYCDRQNYGKRAGDLRYSFFYWVDSVQQVGPLGYGPSSTDPITGETITGDAYLYGGSIDVWAQTAVDLIDLVNGDLDPVAYGYGENISGYISDAAESLGYPDSGFNVPAPNELMELNQAKFERFNEKLTSARERLETGNFAERLDLTQLVRHQDTHTVIWERMKGTEVESRMVTPEIKAGLGAGFFAPDDAVNADMIEALTLRKTGMPPGNGFQRDGLGQDGRNKYWDRFDRYASRNMYMADFLDDALLGWAMDLKDAYGDISDTNERRLRMWYDIRGFLFKHVMEHEVGHTLGLRHNFEASYDSMSFPKEYWDIRFRGDEALSALNQECPGVPGVMLGDHHCPSRGIIREDDVERMREYAYSSTMDYGAKHNSTSKGIGLYDTAALAYGYGELVHVFEKSAVPNKFKITVDANDQFVSIGETSEPIEKWYDIEQYETPTGSDEYNANLDYWHYSVLPLMFGGDSGNMDQMYRRRFVPLDEYNINNPTELRVPYRFCSDEFRGATPYCNVWDDGADFNEISDTYIQAYDAYYFTNSYRRGRAAWGLWLWPHLMRLYSRYFGPISGMYQHFIIRASAWDNWYGNPYAGGLQQVGVEDGLRTLLDVLSTPHPGAYALLDTNADGVEDTFMNIDSDPEYAANDTSVEWLRLEPGMKAKWRFGKFDYDSGYYYFLRYSILSSFWDRWAALMALTNPEYNTVGVDSSSDITGYLIPYYLLYSYELSTIFGGVMTEDMASFAPVVNVAAYQAGDTRKALEMRDPLASVAKRAAYKDPAQYIPVNPYPGAYGNSSVNDRFFASIYGLAFFQVLYDQSFNHASDIFVDSARGDSSPLADSDGDGLLNIQEGSEDYDGDGIPAYLDADDRPVNPAAVMSYTDPFNHRIYSAMKYTEPGSPLFSPGYKILERANNLKARWQAGDPDVSQYDVQNVREDIEWIILCNETFHSINAWEVN